MTTFATGLKIIDAQTITSTTITTVYTAAANTIARFQVRYFSATGGTAAVTLAGDTILDIAAGEKGTGFTLNASSATDGNTEFLYMDEGEAIGFTLTSSGKLVIYVETFNKP